MKTAIYFCTCGTNISGQIDPGQVEARLAGLGDISFKVWDFLCSEDGKSFLENDLRECRPDRVVIAACSPRDHEENFMRVLAEAGINPYFLQMVNIREQIAWVTPDRESALEKAVACIRAAVARVGLHEPLEKNEIDVATSAVIIGSGPAGLKAALCLAQAGRQVILVEKEPVIGGLPVRFEELFPAMECGPCLLEPLLGELLHGEAGARVELLTMAEVTGITGFYGNFNVTIRQRPRHVDSHRCIGCAECTTVCPAACPNPFNQGRNEMKAIDVPFMGALPNVPAIDMAVCLRGRGEECNACKAACPLGEDLIDFASTESIIERQVGAIILATGAGLFDSSAIPGLGLGRIPDVLTSLEFERMLASNGPTDGAIVTSRGTPPAAIAIVHCVGSLNAEHRDYCSGICCQYAFKFNHLIAARLPGTRITHMHRELVLPGKEASAIYRHAAENSSTAFLRTGRDSTIQIAVADDSRIAIAVDALPPVVADMVILCPAIVPAAGTGDLAALLDIPCDQFGFYEELNGRLDPVQSKIRGIYLAGTCQAPMDIQQATLQGMAAAGHVLAGLVPGRKLQIDPITAVVDEQRCAGCRVCNAVCPYMAIGYAAELKRSEVNPVLCHGCGTCVAACPAGAMKGNHFSGSQIMAEMEGLLS